MTEVDDTSSETEIQLTENTKLVRENLIDEYEELYTGICALNQTNLNLESRINQYLKKKLIDNNEVLNKIYSDQEEEDPIQKLNSLFSLYKQVKEQNSKVIELKTKKLKASRNQAEELRLKLVNMNKLFTKKVYDKIETIKYSNIPKANLIKNLESIFATDKHNNTMISNIRVKNLRLMRRINELRHKDSSSVKVNKMELERIKIQNHAYNSRTEKRSDDTSRLLKKLESNSNVITHVNEASYQYENKLKMINERLEWLDKQISILKEDALHNRKEKERVRRNKEELKEKQELRSKPDLIKFYKNMIEKNKVLNNKRTKKIGIIKSVDAKAYQLQNELIKQCEMDSLRSLL